MSEVLNFDFVYNKNEEVFKVKLECTNVGLTTSCKIKLLILYIYIYIEVRNGAILCNFLTIKPHTALHNAV